MISKKITINIYGGNNYLNVGMHLVLEQFNEQLKIKEENKLTHNGNKTR